jgi:tRNA uridine 5-carboxymethylaminomethyl modification enzyme
VARQFDIAVIGLGHAGAEAALAATRLGARVAAVTQVPDRACLMSCNPAIGGPGKSQLVREIDALGGGMAEAADETALQVRLLNRSKGPAGWATRLQVDRLAYARVMQRRLALVASLEVIRGEAVRLRTAGSHVAGVELDDGSVIEAAAVILTTGTFLAARMHVGQTQRAGGRAGDRSSEGLPTQLRELGLETGRFKTGTPPRLKGSSIDWPRCEEQRSEPEVSPLSMRTARAAFPCLPQRSTFVTRTGPRTHAVVMAALGESPLTTGAITGRGPRYCPSLEQKILSYPERLGHLVYLEPDGLQTDEVYPAGLSTSLPAEAQLRFLQTIDGLEGVELLQPGYAVEYDYLKPGQLSAGLELNSLPGLFFAGQINGSSGYEEAAGQGLVAGVNAARLTQGSRPWVPRRDDSYLGVLCDDLVRHSFEEPYRILPARAEQRLLLREDNAALRMVPVGLALGLVDAQTAEPLLRRKAQIDEVEMRLTDGEIRWLQHPQRQVEEARGAGAPLGGLEPELAQAVFVATRYAPYQEQHRVAQARLRALSDVQIPAAMDPKLVPGLSAEARDALDRVRPKRIGEAAALAGVTPEAISILAAHLRRLSQLVAAGVAPVPVAPALSPESRLAGRIQKGTVSRGTLD